MIGRLYLNTLSKSKALSIVALLYLMAFALACAVFLLLKGHPPLMRLAIADIAATIFIFLTSMGTNNSSMYDPYWSVAPIPIAALWFFSTDQPDTAMLVRGIAVITLVSIWGMRLTYNWARHWQGFIQEDWRYRDFRARFPKAYWLVSVAGIHMFPTAIVFVACIPLQFSMQHGAGLNPLDALAVLVTITAIALETFADAQLSRFVKSNPPADAILADGLWKYCRHPNYLGEILFWWGLALFGLATTKVTWWWSVAGAAAMTLMFLTVSIPMKERRMLARRPSYAERKKRVSLLIPLPPK